MKLILDRGKEILGNRGVRVVISLKRVYVRDFLIEPSFARPNLANPFKKFLEIVLTEYGFALLEPLVVQHEPLDYKLFKRFCGPDTELGRLVGIYTVSHGDDGVEILEFHLPADLAPTLGLNYFQNGNSCILIQFTGIKNIGQMLTDGRCFYAK